MKILVVCQYYYPEPFRVTDICEELVKRGHNITVLTGLPNYPDGKILKEYKEKEHRNEVRNGVRIIRCNEYPRGKSAFRLLINYFSFALFGVSAVKKLDKDFDLVFINQLTPVMMALPGIKYAKKNKKKSLLYCYDLWPASLSIGGIKQSSIIYKFFAIISRKIYNSVDYIFTTSRSFIDYLFEEHKINKNKIGYLPQYCEDLFSDIENKPHDGFNFVFAGNIGETQSVETIIKAANLLKDRKDIKFHVVGDGRDFSNCKKLAKELKADNIIFYGRKSVDEMPFFYSMADAMLVTMIKNDLISKTLPGKIQSYMAAGKPIIAAIDGEAKDIILEAKCGLVCGAEDYKNLAKIIAGLNKEKCENYSFFSKEYYKKHFIKNKFFETLERKYYEY